MSDGTKLTLEAIITFLEDHVRKRHQREIPPITPETQLLQTGLIDSLQLVELAVGLAQHFSLQVSNSDFIPEDFETPAILWERLKSLAA